MTPERRAAVETVIDLWVSEGDPSDYRTAACNLWDECEELRAALAAAEAKLTAYGDTLLGVGALLAAERRHLDDAAFLLDRAFEFGDLCDQIHAEDCPQDDTCECPEAARLNRVMLFHALRARRAAEFAR